MSDLDSTARQPLQFAEPNAADAAAIRGPSHTRSSRRRRSDWRLGGRSIRKWDLSTLATALLCLGAGTVASTLVAQINAAWAPLLSALALWVGLSAAVIAATVRARPAGLFQLTAVDLLWGIGVGSLLRLVQGWLSNANGAGFPAAPAGSFSGNSWWLAEVLSAALLAPVLEELFFRGVILVVVYQIFRRSVGSLAAGVTALLVSSGTFVILHAGFGSVTLSDGLQFLVLGASCSLLVLLTGRVWAAVLVHVVYNVSYVLLLAVGTAFS